MTPPARKRRRARTAAAAYRADERLAASAPCLTAARPDGSLHESHGEWFFSRTLEGRAIQDVWIAPERPRAAPTPDLPNRYGSTMRMFDRDKGQWRIAWFNPVTGAFNVLMGRREQGRIIHDGVRDGQRIRWTFAEIGPDRFHWIGESEQPDGAWLREAEFFGQRRR